MLPPLPQRGSPQRPAHMGQCQGVCKDLPRSRRRPARMGVRPILRGYALWPKPPSGMYGAVRRVVGVRRNIF